MSQVDDSPISADTAITPQEPQKGDIGPITQVFNISEVNGGRIGLSGRRTGAPTKSTGRLDETDVKTATRFYVAPACYDAAVSALLRNHVVVLEGNPGSGRRAGAIRLLREVTEHGLVVLSPIVTLRQLETYRFERDRGYAIIDRIAEDPAADTDFTWRTIRDKVRTEGTFLVITTTVSNAGPTPESVRHVAWSKPELREVLRSHLSALPAGIADEVIEDVLPHIPDDWTMATIAKVAKRIAKGEKAVEAAAEFDDSARLVHAWFEAPRTRAEIIDVAALAFTHGASDRTFESLCANLVTQVGTYLPAPEQDATRQDIDRLPAGRARRFTLDSLIRTQAFNDDGTTRRGLIFRTPGHRQHVIQELWQRYETPFWDAVGVWLNDLVTQRDFILGPGGVEIADGLALLAMADLDEVEDSFLDPWSAGTQGWPGQVTAALVISLMSCQETLAPAALRIAVSWANSGDKQQRRTSVVALCSELAQRYPVEAMRQLWHLVASGGFAVKDQLEDDTLFSPIHSFGWMFSILAENRPRSASVLLKMLCNNLEKFSQPGADRRLQELTLYATLLLQRVESSDGKLPAIMAYVAAHSDKAPLVAQLWAGTLIRRPYRRAALEALRDGLQALVKSGVKPYETANSLFAALAEALPPSEHGPLSRDFFAQLDSKRTKDSQQLTSILLAALERVQQQHSTKEGP